MGLTHKWGNVWDVHTEQGSVGVERRFGSARMRRVGEGN